MSNKLIRFAKNLGMKAPVIIQAPMAGGITRPQLVAAVANNSSLGSFATGYLKTTEVVAGIRAIKQLTPHPFGVNLFIPPSVFTPNDKQITQYQHVLNQFRKQLGLPLEQSNNTSLPPDNLHEMIDVILQEKIKVVSFTFGILPKDIIETLHKASVCLMGTATSLEEARALADADIDVIVAQGYEAGGHRGSFISPVKTSSIGTMTLVSQLTRSLDKPIIAAGGIMHGSEITAAIALGAVGVQMGTAFLATPESGANPAYKSALLQQQQAATDKTTFTTAYSGKMARGINTAFIKAVEEQVPQIPVYPLPHHLSKTIRQEAGKQGLTNYMSLWAGQGLPLIRANLTAAELINCLRDEIDASLQQLDELSIESQLNASILEKKNLNSTATRI